VVLRVFDRGLADAVADGFGFRYVRSTAALAAPWFVGAAVGLDGLAMGELAGRTRVVAIGRTDGTLEYPPRSDTRFAAGDSAFLVGPYEELRSSSPCCAATPRPPTRAAADITSASTDSPL
jgi:hypothetical protein